MIKVTIKGEVYSFDNERYPLAEAIELERGIDMPFGVWRTTGLATGSSVALAGFAYLVLKRNGQKVPLEDILSGKFELDTSDISVEEEGGDDAEGPTSPGSKPGETSGSPS
ncbi:MAG TPA: hypothetical protein VF223_19155 [Trebonia sp.]